MTGGCDGKVRTVPLRKATQQSHVDLLLGVKTPSITNSKPHPILTLEPELRRRIPFKIVLLIEMYSERCIHTHTLISSRSYASTTIRGAPFARHLHFVASKLQLNSFARSGFRGKSNRLTSNAKVWMCFQLTFHPKSSVWWRRSKRSTGLKRFATNLRWPITTSLLLSIIGSRLFRQLSLRTVTAQNGCLLASMSYSVTCIGSRDAGSALLPEPSPCQAARKDLFNGSGGTQASYATPICLIG